MVTAEKVNNRMAKKSTATAAKAPRIAKDAKSNDSKSVASTAKKKNRKADDAASTMAAQNSNLKTTLQQIEYVEGWNSMVFNKKRALLCFIFRGRGFL